MTTSATTMEEKLANLTKMIEGLVKHTPEQDLKIEKLMQKVDGAEARRDGKTR